MAAWVQRACERPNCDAGWRDVGLECDRCELYVRLYFVGADGRHGYRAVDLRRPITSLVVKSTRQGRPVVPEAVVLALRSGLASEAKLEEGPDAD